MLDPYEDISSLGVGQEKVISILPIISAILSCIGSSNIICMVLRSWQEKQTPYRRILLGMSCCDVVSSITVPLQGFLIPAATSQRAWAFGNSISCTALGFFQQFSFSGIWYNGMLSFYFLLVVRFGVKQQDLARRYEPWMHLLSIGYPLITAIVGAVMGVYDETKVGKSCWVTNYPKGCGCNELDTGECCTSPQIAWVFGGMPSGLTFVVILINNLLVYWHVRSTIRRSLLLQSSSIMDPTTRLSGSASNQNHPSILQQQPASSAGFTTPQTEKDHRRRRPSSQYDHDQQPTNPPKGRKTRDPQLLRIRAVATQAFLYVLAFLLTYTPSMTLRIMESRNFDAEDEDALFPLLVLQSMLLPLGGFWNCFVFVRPSFLRARKDYPNESYWWSFRRALHGSTVHPTSASMRPSATTSQPQPPPFGNGSASTSKLRKTRRSALQPQVIATNNNNNNNSRVGGASSSGCSFACAGVSSSASASASTTTQAQAQEQQEPVPNGTTSIISNNNSSSNSRSRLFKMPNPSSSSSSSYSSLSSRLWSSIRNSLIQETEYSHNNNNNLYHDHHHNEQRQDNNTSRSSCTSATTTTVFTEIERITTTTSHHCVMEHQEEEEEEEEDDVQEEGDTEDDCFHHQQPEQEQEQQHTRELLESSKTIYDSNIVDHHHPIQDNGEAEEGVNDDDHNSTYSRTNEEMISLSFQDEEEEDQLDKEEEEQDDDGDDDSNYDTDRMYFL